MESTTTARPHNPVRGRINALLLRLLDAYMHAKYGALKARLFADLPARVVELGPGAGLPLASDSVDVVIATLVLCTVPDPGTVLGEVKRVLRPDGRFICIEHVAGRPGSFVAFLQRLLHRPWHWSFEGCHTNRPTARWLREAGFARVDCEELTVPTALVPIRPQIAAVCTKLLSASGGTPATPATSH